MMSAPMFCLAAALAMAGRAAAQCQTPTTNFCGVDCYPVNNLYNRDIQQAMAEQPIYYTFLPNVSDNCQVDNICATVFPVRGSQDAFIYNYARTFSNGSIEYITYVVASFSPGVNYYATIGFLYTEFYLGKTNCNSYVTYSCGNYGDYPLPYVYGTTADCGCLPISQNCLQSAKSIIQSAGLTPGDYVILPNKLPNACQTRGVCLPRNNPLYAAQGGRCAPYASACSSFNQIA